MPYSLESIAKLAVDKGYPERAIRFLAAASNLRRSLGTPLPLRDKRKLEPYYAKLKQMNTYYLEWQKGTALSVDEAVDLTQHTCHCRQRSHENGRK